MSFEKLDQHNLRTIESQRRWRSREAEKYFKEMWLEIQVFGNKISKFHENYTPSLKKINKLQAQETEGKLYQNSSNYLKLVLKENLKGIWEQRTHYKSSKVGK